ncbi:MAG TPA: T9SS type A sorting domain-containing protein, partial [Cyclobacteriaceae bacterium]|nr:T9SS type A sorting domain-containing protein [Cyclobacteriaceae bacterium]
EITGYTTYSSATASGNWNQSFGNVEWNCVLQSTRMKMNGLLQNITGNFSVINTGSSLLELSTNQALTINIAGDMTITNNSIVYFSTAPTSGNSIESLQINIGGNFSYSSTNPAGSETNEKKKTTLNINGNFYMNAPGGKLIVSLKDSNTISGEGTTFNIAGNFNLVAGEIFCNDVGTEVGYFNFIGTNAVHTFQNTGSINGAISYSVAKTNTLHLIEEAALSGGTNSSFTLGETTGGATLIVESLDSSGAIQQGSKGGNIRAGNSAHRTYNANSTIIYKGQAAQFIGNGQPGTTDAGTATKSLITIVDNSYGVSLNSTTTTVTVAGEFRLSHGDLSIVNNSFTVNGDLNLDGGNINMNTSTGKGAKTLTVKSVINLSGGQINLLSGNANGENATLAINGDVTGTKYFTFTGPNCRVTIGGTSPLQFSRTFPIDHPAKLEQLTINRNGATLIVPQNLNIGNEANTTSGLTLAGGDLQMKGDLTVDVNLKLTSGTLYFQDHTLELKRAITCTEQTSPTPSGYLSGNENSILKVTGSYSNSSALNTMLFSPLGNTLGTMIINRTVLQNLPHVTLKNSLQIVHTLSLMNGKLHNPSGLTMASNSTLIRTNNSALYDGSVAPLGGPYKVQYSNGNSTTPTKLVTGIELKGLLSNLENRFSDTLKLSTIATISDTLMIASGTWLSGINNIKSKVLLNKSIFVAPDTLILAGNFINDGTYYNNNGLVSFNGTSVITGTVKPVFNTIEISGILSSPANFNLELRGDFINNGIFNHANGTVLFAGTTSQKISGASKTEFQNINLTNSSTSPSLFIESDCDLFGVLTLAANTTMDADGSTGEGNLTLRSTNDSPSADASIAELPSGAAILGDVTVQRYVSGEGRIYRYLSSPVNSVTVADWMDDFPVTGKFKDPSTSTQWPAMYGYPINSKSTTLYYYDEMKSNYVAYPFEDKLSKESILEPGRGYTAFMRQCAEPILIDVRGQVNQGQIQLPVTYTSDTSRYIGWNLIGNPYPSSISWEADGSTGWTKENVAKTIAIRDNGLGAFKYWDGTGIPNDIQEGVIASGQAFWIRTTGAKPKLIAREGIKSQGNSSYFRKSQPVALTIELKQNEKSDMAYVKLRSEAREGLDDYDAVKLDNSFFDIATLSTDSIALAINAMPQFLCTQGIDIKLTDLSDGNYTMKFSFTEDTLNTHIKLHDNYTNTSYSLYWDKPFTFTASKNVVRDAVRFTLFLSNDNIPEPFVTSESICASENILTVTNTNLKTNYSVWLSSGEKISNDINGLDHDTLHIPIETSLLKSGVNQIYLRSEDLCQVSTSPFELKYSNPVIDSVSTNYSCLEGPVTLSIYSDSINYTYNWYTEKDSSTPIASSQHFTTPILNESKTYYASITEPSGCESKRVEAVAKIVKYEKPVIRVEGNVMITNYSNHVQWYFNDVLIPGADSSRIIINETGMYSMHTEVDGCTAKTEMPFIVTGNDSFISEFNIYPNPFTDFLSIELPKNIKIIKQIFIYNSKGAEIDIQNHQHENKVYFNTSKLPVGLYVIRLTTEENNSTICKVLKAN